MKAMILEHLSDLIETDDVHLRSLLKSKLVVALNMVSLNLDNENEQHIKRLIVETIKRYADTSDPALKSALQDHYKTLERLIINYC